MSESSFKTGHLDYLLRTSAFRPEDLISTSLWTNAPDDMRRLFLVKGIGYLEKNFSARYLADNQAYRIPSEDLINGLYAHHIPLVFLVRNAPSGVAVNLGTWSYPREGKSSTELDQRQTILHSLVRATYVTAELADSETELLAKLSKGGYVLGIPTTKPQTLIDNALPIDRLIRALPDEPWAFLILAQPFLRKDLITRRNDVNEEIRMVENEAQARKNSQPLADHYVELLQLEVKSLLRGMSIGAWRTAVYLLGEDAGYFRLASVWSSIFSGEQSQPEPISIWQHEGVFNLTSNWAMPDIDIPKGPGKYQRPFQYQTLLTSSQLAAYIHMPQVETRGFEISQVPNFDVVRRVENDPHFIGLGQIVQRTIKTKLDYTLTLKPLTRHMSIFGVTGSGKTNTIFYLLLQLELYNIPFMVIEPAKAEYRSLLNAPRLKDKLQVFTLGDEGVSPFRVNPFEVVGWPKTSVNVHIDLLRSVFAASFGMWTPLPQVLEQCLYRIYLDRGWDIATNTNKRLEPNADPWFSFPTLSDLVAKVDEVVRELGYEERVEKDIRAALLTRINSLRSGAKGSMLDVQRSLPMKVLLQHSTILELEDMGDDDDKAFLIGLLFVRLVEYRRSQGNKEDLQHVLVIEEAHRLLANLPRRSSEYEGDPRGKAVETFTTILAEIRAFGQGLFIADQIPTKLVPDVIKNTGLKIAHQIVAADDIEALALAMNMNELQRQALVALPAGRVAVFGKNDDAPVLVEVPEVKDRLMKDPLTHEHIWPTDEIIRQHMGALRESLGYEMVFEQTLAGQAAQSARDLAVDRSFQRLFSRLILSAMLSPMAVERLLPELLSIAENERPPRVEKSLFQVFLIQFASNRYAERRGAQAGWSYGDTQRFAITIHNFLLTKSKIDAPWISSMLTKHYGHDLQTAEKEFQNQARSLHRFPCPPYPSCVQIHQQQSLICPYRYAIADLLTMRDLLPRWKQAFLEDQSVNNGGRPNTWDLCHKASFEILDPYVSSKKSSEELSPLPPEYQASLCLGQQALLHDQTLLPESIRVIIDELIREYDRQNSQQT